MKKFLFAIFLIFLLGYPTAVVFAEESELIFSQKTLTIVAGRNYDVDVFVDSGSVKDYVVKMALDFPANLLEEKKFTFAEGWIAVTVPPYDITDNKSGTLIKSAGYPAGFLGKLKLGTISFYSKRGGSGKLTFLPESLAYNESGRNTLLDYSATLAINAGVGNIALKPVSQSTTAVSAVVPEPMKTVLPKELIPPARPFIREKLVVEPLPTPGAVVEISDYEKYLQQMELDKLIQDDKNQAQILDDKINQMKNSFVAPFYTMIGSLLIVFVGVIVAGFGSRNVRV